MSGHTANLNSFFTSAADIEHLLIDVNIRIGLKEIIPLTLIVISAYYNNMNIY